MKEFFRAWSPREKSKNLVYLCNEIIDEYQADGFKLTLRQLYYQLVSRDHIPNNQKSYSNLGSLVGNARLAGMMDWEAIEDRVRRPHFFGHFSGLDACVEWALREYRLDRWAGQDYYAEIWVEKDALANILQPIADELHVVLMVNKGYSSLSAMKESAERFERCGEGKAKILYYMGDFDPSGEDMVRDVHDRLHMFGVTDLEVKKLALTLPQVRKYDPPPNPVKLTDSRAKEFMDKFKIDESWELDALTPQVLRKVLMQHFNKILDRDLMNDVIMDEETDKTTLRDAVEDMDG